MASRKWGVAVLCTAAAGLLYVLTPEQCTTKQPESQQHVAEKQQTIHQLVTPTRTPELKATLETITEEEGNEEVNERAETMDRPSDNLRLSHYLNQLVQTGELSEDDKKFWESLKNEENDLLSLYKSSHFNLEALLITLEGHELKATFISNIIEYCERRTVSMAVVAYEIDSALQSPYAGRIKQHVVDEINKDLDRRRELASDSWYEHLYKNEYVHDLHQEKRKKHYTNEEVSTIVTKLSADLAKSHPALLHRLLQRTKEYYQDKRTEPVYFNAYARLSFINQLRDERALSQSNGDHERAKKSQEMIDILEETYRKWKSGELQQQHVQKYAKLISEVDDVMQALR